MKRKDHKAVGWLWGVTGRDKWKILWMTIVQMLSAAAGVSLALFLRGVIDSAVDRDRSLFIHYALLLILVTVLQLVFRALLRYLTEASKSSLENRCKSRLFSVLLMKDFGSVTAVHSGEWMNRLTSDTAVVADGLSTILPGVMGLAVRLIGAVVLILYLLPSLAFIIIPGGVLLVLLSFGFRKVLKRLHKEIQEADGRLRIFLTERISSLLIVRTFGKTQQTAEEADEKMKEHKKARMKRNRFSNLCNVGFGIAMNGAYVFSAIYCAHGILAGTLSYGTFTAILQLVGQIQTPFANISGYLPKFYAMLASAERLMEAEAFRDEDLTDCLDDQEIQDLYREEMEDITLSKVSFTYRSPDREDDPVVIRDLDLTIHKGEYVAFAGHSGCGKSTVLKLLLCLYPLDEGERILGLRTGQVPLTAGYRGLFAYVPQGNQLVSGSIRQIVAFGDEKAMREEERLWTALHIACADEFVSQLEDGLDTVLGERGMGLSEGQMQRIAIARAVFTDRPVLLLDEATSSLDEKTEAELLEHLRAMTDKTVVIVTHRPAALGICDRTIRFTGGMTYDERRDDTSSS